VQQDHSILVGGYVSCDVPLSNWIVDFEKIQVQSMRLDNLPPNQDSISAALQTLIDDEINQGAVPINSEFQQRYMNALRRAFELGTVVSISRQNPGLSLPALNESANISTHTDFSNIVASALPNETISTQLTGNEQQEHDSNTGHLLEESPSFDNEMSFGNHTPSFQTLQASASQSSMTPNVFDSPQYNDILQGASAMDRSSLLPRSTPDFGVPFAQPNLSEGTASLDLAHHQEPDDFFGIDFDPDFIDLTSFHMTQDETPVLPADEMHLGASEYDVNAPLGGGSLMAYLELEGESPAAMAEWKDNKDRNMGLSRP
jgi:hypothetical protein